IVQSRTGDDNLVKLRKAYGVVFELSEALGLVLEHSKSEVCHFSRKSGDDNPPVDLGYAPYTGDTPLRPKTFWRYLGFWFDPALTFMEHTQLYSTKALTTVRAMMRLGNFIRGISPNNKRLLYRTCVLPVATYGSRLWNYEGCWNKGPLQELKIMQAKAARWITGSFCTAPNGAVETIAGLPPIHLHIRKLVERSHVQVRTLARSHSVCMLIDGDHPMSMSELSIGERAKVRSPITEAWANSDLCTVDLYPHNEFNIPGSRIVDVCPERIVFDTPSPVRGKREAVKKYREVRKEALEKAFLDASTSADCLTVVCDASVPGGPHQAVSAWSVWSFGLEIQRDWAAAGLALPEDAELHAISQAVTCTVKELEGKGKLHIFADSLTPLKWAVDPSLHSSQVHSLNFLWHVWLWLHGEAGSHIVLHYVDKDVGLDMHSLVHLLATSTKVEAGGAPERSMGYARMQLILNMLREWGKMSLSSRYIGHRYIRLCEGLGVIIQPSHLRGGHVFKAVGRSNRLAARLVCGLTGHAPIGTYRERFHHLPSHCISGHPFEHAY